MKAQLIPAPDVEAHKAPHALDVERAFIDGPEGRVELEIRPQDERPERIILQGPSGEITLESDPKKGSDYYRVVDGAPDVEAHSVQIRLYDSDGPGARSLRMVW